MSGLLCLGRRTVTGLLSICGPQFRDWSASYRLFSQERFDQPAVFAGIRRAVLEKLPPGAPLCLAMDDSLLPKTGAKIHGVAWRRDPLGPAFQTNLIRAQRVLQISAGLPGATPVEGVRMVPVAFAHAPTPAKPRPHAPASQWAAYRQACRNSRLSVQARTQLQALHEWLRCEPLAQGRPVRLVVDGGYTNETVLKNLPAGVTLIGRIRKDAKLYYPPEAGRPRSTGRRLQYGQRAPTSTAPWIGKP